MRLDHAVVAGRDQERLVSRFADAGFDPAFGGVHDHGTTRMSVLGFPDGSYLELLGPTPDTDPAEAAFWPDHLARDAGPTAWCLLVDDAADSAVAHVRAGVPVDGPHHRGRERPDGTRVEWDMVFYGDETAGTAFPFVIADRTPRRYRVAPTTGLADGPLAGIAQVVVGVADAGAWAERFADCYRTPAPVAFDHPGLEAPLFDVPGRPLVLAESDPAVPGPTAFLLGTGDLDAVGDAVDLVPADDWHGRRFAWVAGFEGDLGVAEPEPGGDVSAGPVGR